MTSWRANEGDGLGGIDGKDARLIATSDGGDVVIKGDTIVEMPNVAIIDGEDIIGGDGVIGGVVRRVVAPGEDKGKSSSICVPSVSKRGVVSAFSPA